MIRLLSLFSGIGAFEKALDRIGAKYELVNYCEIDKYASVSYAAVHGVSEELNLRDVQTIDCDRLKSRGVNLITYGFPCQDISVAGKMRGFEHNGQKTRSGLFYDALKVIRELQPEVAIAENVKALTGKKFEAEFAAVRGGLADAGYNNYYAVLNASDYSIPQHRERVFIVSIRKDIDRDKFAFPQKEPLRLRVKDLLEYEVEEKYYIDTDRARELIRKLAEEGKLPGNEPAVAAMRGRDPENPNNRHSGVHTEQKMEVNTFGTSNTITTVQKDNHIIEPNIKTVGNLDGHETGRVLDTDGITQSLKGTDHKNPVKIALKQVGEIGSCQSGRIYDSDGCCPTLNTAQGGQKQPKIIDVINEYRIRKLTPKECWRLMGFDDEDFEKAKAAGISNTQLYKQAGNSIVVNVLEAIFKKLFAQVKL